MSSIALGVVLLKIVEDATWLRPKMTQPTAIIVNLIFAIQGINMAFQWGRQEMMQKTDLAISMDG